MPKEKKSASTGSASAAVNAAAASTAKDAGKDAGKDAAKDKAAAKAKSSATAAGTGAKLPLKAINYLLVLVLLASLASFGYFGYFGYKTIIDNEEVISKRLAEQKEQIQQLLQQYTATRSDLGIQEENLAGVRGEVGDLEKELDTLDRLSVLTQERLEKIEGEIKPQEIWLLQISQLVYLAEQERAIGGRAAAINYLLLQANQLADKASANAEVLRIKQALTRDLESYEIYHDFDVSVPYSQLAELDRIINEQLQFPSDSFAASPAEPEDLEETADSGVGNVLISSIFKIFDSIKPYFRISTNAQQKKPLGHEQQTLLKLSLSSKVDQAKNAAIKGQQDLFRSVLLEVRQGLSANFVEGDAQTRALEIVDELDALDTISADLPQLRSYALLFSGIN